MEIIDVEQGSAQWFAARLGIPTASEFGTILAKGKEGGASKTRADYLYKLAGEAYTGQPMEAYRNEQMDRGNAMEDEARAEYAFVAGVECKRVGFIRSGRKGASPDRLIGASGMVEIKTKAPHLLAKIIHRDGNLPEHIPQCQGQLWIAEREWVDLVCYWPLMPIFIKRITRDEVFIRRLAEAVDAFNEELDEIVATIRRYGQPAAKPAPARPPLIVAG